MQVTVLYSKKFLNDIATLSDDELKLIGDFAVSLKSSGFDGLPGRNKPSTGVSKRHAQREKLIQYAIQNRLWHYHIGHVEYDKNRSFGDWTSEYVVQYQNNNFKEARFVSYDPHPPFKLPPPESLD
ncbi:hypothetical protein GZ607_002562 [Salmonella enterica subsp. enterica serovar Pomona]|uniref:Uncharacterized protein n=1 Tax=Enterobacter roggenkampii TaxID=1812935 RepID=A0A837LE43_9ENTR|nr:MULTISPECIES: hypothetical protein [Enterobacter]EEH6937962.1 hypothetical protein [Salmonella enterica subsp. enterica serovar Pomona]EEZ0928932.1 hypothetical protein [Escherichia coli]EHQ5579837.1 hypothetical protein [Escherichia coli O2]EME6961231.1 hypothetical protein [Salmonella enterica]EFB9783518.1 hypothetical protein [Escherichia coli]